MAIKGINVGAWKLEDDAQKIELELSATTQAKLLGLLALMPLYGKRCHQIYDLVTKNPVSGRVDLCSARPVRAQTAFDDIDVHVNGVDLRFNQPILLGSHAMLLTSIFCSTDLAFGTPQIITGGRKLMHADPRVLDSGSLRYNSQHDILNDIEELAPVTEEGIAIRLDQMTDYYSVEQRSKRIRDEFAALASDLALTV